jgi:hypothetical protein
MPCCGQNREKARIAAAQPPAPLRANLAAPAKGPFQPVAANSVRLRYRGSTSISVKGLRSGRSYTFSGREPERAVDGRDVEALLRIGLFQRAS